MATRPPRQRSSPSAGLVAVACVFSGYHRVRSRRPWHGPPKSRHRGVGLTCTVPLSRERDMALRQPTVGQLGEKPRSPGVHLTTDSPRYGIPTQLGSCLQDSTSRCRPHGSPAGAAHQSDVPKPHGPSRLTGCAEVSPDNRATMHANSNATGSRVPRIASVPVERPGVNGPASTEGRVRSRAKAAGFGP